MYESISKIIKYCKKRKYLKYKNAKAKKYLANTYKYKPRPISINRRKILNEMD